MALSFGWTSGFSSSLEIIIITIIFAIVYIKLHTFCINCFSQKPESPHCPEKKDIPSSVLPKETKEDQGGTNRTSGSELAESHGFFPRGNMPRLPDTPVFSIESAGSLYPRIPDPTLFPSTLYQARAQAQPVLRVPLIQRTETVIRDQDILDREDQTNIHNIFNEHTYSLLECVSEEHPYESIGMERFCVSTPPSPLEGATEDQSDSESHYQTVSGPGELAASQSSSFHNMMDNRETEKPELLFPPLPNVKDDQCLAGTEQTVIYAAVNRHNKSIKLQELSLSPGELVLDEEEEAEEAAPPVPEKIFEK
ncbi:uncharacterized protein [Hoplias malabaricus]|uniref:uncharacterized protein n=1 Tax=Hoplias malabaricus TaxID=27720 RepID=UPI0034625DAC